VLPVVFGLIVLVALLTPEEMRGRGGDARLTTHSANSQGARLLYELAQRLGWRVERWSAISVLPSDPKAILAVLEPPEPLSAIETHRVLDHVRAGGAFLYVMNARGPMNDSLHIRRGLFGGTYKETEAGTADAPVARAARDTTPIATADSSTADTTDVAAEDDDVVPSECGGYDRQGGGLPMWDVPGIALYQFDWTRPRPAELVVFALAELGTSRRDSVRRLPTPAAAGFPVGRGRVVIVSDADLFRNDVLRVCRWGVDVVTVRILEYLSGGAVRRDRLVFDEYHQGYGPHPGTLRAIVRYLSRAASGHMLAQALAAGLVLLLALGPRALAPRDVERAERRSPLEHVSALAAAYAHVGATRTATRHLLRGVRRRVERAVRGSGAPRREERDDSFLDSARRDVPGLEPDTLLVQRALAAPVSRREFEAVGGALRRIESSLLTLRR
jgi:hypothetical protein